MLFLPLLLTVTCQSADTQVIEGKTPHDLALSLRQFGDPIFIASAPIEVNFKFTWTKKEQGQDSAEVFFRKKFSTASKETPIVGLETKSGAIVARPRFHYPAIKFSPYPQGDQLRFFPESMLPNYPTTPASEIKLRDGMVIHEGNEPISMTMVNLKPLFQNRLHMHWMIERTWVTMDFESMPEEDFLNALAKSTGGLLKKEGSLWRIHLDPEFVRPMWEETLVRFTEQRDDAPNIKSPTESYYQQSRTVRKVLLKRAFSNDELVHALELTDSSTSVYNQLTDENGLQDAKNLVISELKDPNSLWIQLRGKNTPRDIAWDSPDWRVSANWPSVFIIIPIKDRQKHYLRF